MMTCIDTALIPGNFGLHLIEEASLPFYESENTFLKKVSGIAFRALEFLAGALIVGAFLPLFLLKTIISIFDRKGKSISMIEESVEETAKRFLPSFDVGFASCDYQLFGKNHFPNSQWAVFEEKCLAEDNRSDNGVEVFWRNPEALILELKKFHISSYRFSVEWSEIEPREGEFNEVALEYYTRFSQLLVENGIKPMVTLHHFSEPQWFAAKGGFEKEENIGAFIKFSKEVFNSLNKHVKQFCTFNEPAIYSFCGYVMGTFPPGKNDPQLSGIVLANLLFAHSQTYDALKEEDTSGDCEIGLVHNYLTFRPYHAWNPFERVPASFLTRMTNSAVMTAIATGEFVYKIPFVANVNRKFVPLKDKIDFIGLNYYSRVHLAQRCALQCLAPAPLTGQVMTQMPYATDPEGILEAIHEFSKATVNKDIHITETGISTKEGKVRERFYHRVMQVVGLALQKGYSIKSCHLWSIVKNFEWAEGWDPQDFGALNYSRDTHVIKRNPGSEIIEQLFRQMRRIPVREVS